MTSLLLRSLATMAFYLGTLDAARGRPAWFLWWVPLVGLGVLLVRWFGWSAIVDLVMGIALAQPVALTGFLLLLWRKGDVHSEPGPALKQDGADAVVIVYDDLQMPQHFRGTGTVTPPVDAGTAGPVPWYQRPVRVRFQDRTYDLILPASVVFPADAVPPLG